MSLPPCQCAEPGMFCQRFQCKMPIGRWNVCNGRSKMSEDQALEYLQTLTERIEYGKPGTCLQKLLKESKISKDKETSMNEWGTQGCKEHKEEIKEWLKELPDVSKLSKQSWFNLSDPYGSIIDEAIRKSEIKKVEPSKQGYPGNQLKKLLEKFGYFAGKQCSSCGLWIDKMNNWGVEGCKEHKQEIIDHLIHEAKGRGWLDKLAAQVGGAKWLVNEAINIAEELEAKRTKS